MKRLGERVQCTDCHTGSGIEVTGTQARANVIGVTTLNPEMSDT